MMVPGNAVGRTGLCPECSTTIPIREDNTRPYKRKRTRSNAVAPLARARENGGASEDSWRQFATAVDLYNQRRYAEALTLLSKLESDYPGNPHINAAREQCLRALQETIDPGMRYAEPDLDAGQLTPDLVRRVILDKLLNGETEDIQMRAAELAARCIGMLASGASPEEDSPNIVLRPEQKADSAPEALLDQDRTETGAAETMEGEGKPAAEEKSSETKRTSPARNGKGRPRKRGRSGPSRSRKKRP
jgi:hypothetical protein